MPFFARWLIKLADVRIKDASATHEEYTLPAAFVVLRFYRQRPPSNDSIEPANHPELTVNPKPQSLSISTSTILFRGTAAVFQKVTFTADE